MEKLIFIFLELYAKALILSARMAQGQALN
jgi:hypothetical protein